MFLNTFIFIYIYLYIVLHIQNNKKKNSFFSFRLHKEIIFCFIFFILKNNYKNIYIYKIDRTFWEINFF